MESKCLVLFTSLLHPTTLSFSEMQGVVTRPIPLQFFHLKCPWVYKDFNT
ncbi:BnaCnng74760D [Brassica napus]|uniref:BnaCnng74760D protein n=2 Tax=Brassica TaxID=3705 RepID=A0A078JYT9_BRANA|nr:BnaCnng74760D [Brassica napus]VDD10371.1 unnamed protein product [Brassica oleracea]